MHDGVDALVRSESGNDFKTVEGVELDVLFGNHILHSGREFRIHFFGSPLRVEQEGAALFEVGEHIVTEHVRLVVAGYEVCLVDKVSAADRLIRETEVRNGDAARFFGVVSKVSLSIFFGVVTDDFDAVLVCADGAVRAETVEFAGDAACVGSVDFFGNFKRVSRDVVGDADCEAVFFGSVHVGIDGVDH